MAIRMGFSLRILPGNAMNFRNGTRIVMLRQAPRNRRIRSRESPANIRKFLESYATAMPSVKPAAHWHHRRRVMARGAFSQEKRMTPTIFRGSRAFSRIGIGERFGVCS